MNDLSIVGWAQIKHDSLKSDSIMTNKEFTELGNRIDELTKECDELSSAKENLIKDLGIVHAKMGDKMEALRNDNKFLLESLRKLNFEVFVFRAT